MKKAIMLALVFVSASMSFAQDYNLYVESTQGTDLGGYDLKQVQKVTFESGNVVITKKDGSKEQTNLANVNRLYFSTKPLAVDGVEVDKNTESEVFDIQGRKVVRPTEGLYIVNGKKMYISNK